MLFRFRPYVAEAFRLAAAFGPPQQLGEDIGAQKRAPVSIPA
jgi:hypothetical protein